MSVYRIKAEGHRDILSVVEAQSGRLALMGYCNEILRKGERKMIKANPDRLLITTKDGLRRAYYAEKVK